MAKLLSILLQRNDPGYCWGFTVQGGWEQSAPLVIDQVSLGTMASHYLAPGDTILEIDKMDARTLKQSEVEELISRPGKSLDLLILKGEGVVSPYQPTAKFNFSRSVGSPDSARSHSSRGYVSGESNTDSSTYNRRNIQSLKDNFWSRVNDDQRDFYKEGFTRLNSGYHSPYKDMPSRRDHWRRCQSEEKSNFKLDENYSSVFTDKEKSSSNINPNRIHSVWSPTPSDRFRTPMSDYWSQDEKTPPQEKHQRDTTNWEDSSERQNLSRSGSFSKTYQRHNSDYNYGYSSLSSEYASTPKVSSNYPESHFKFEESFMKKPSDFWSDSYRDQQGHLRLSRLKSPPPFTKDSILKNTNISSKSEFKKSVSIKEQSYSSSDGPKLFETYEHINKTKETEKSSKSEDGGQEKFVEKTKKNKEYIFANKNEIDGQPKETKQIINDFKEIEKVVDGEHEYCNKTKERSEEFTDSSTPVNFYDNVQQDISEKSEKKENSSSTSFRQREDKDFSDQSRSKEATDDNTVRFYPQTNKDIHEKRTDSMSMTGDGYMEEPLMENYLEVDIRTPLKTDNLYTSKEEILRKQSSQISGGGSPVPISPQGDVPAAPPPPPPPSFPPAPPPPPPPGLSGNIPAVRLSTQIPDKRQSGYEPPAAIQNAMMTKDKKPFTYTPGGLDLSEIRSPRMARRISRNANAPDSASVQTRPAPPPSNQPLPPSAVAAMQPQIAVAVLPPGGGMPHLQHVTPGGHSAHSAPAPSPPPPQLKSHPISPLAQNMPSPPPQPSSPQRVINRQPSPPLVTAEKLQPQHRHTKSEPQSTPGSIYVPPIETQQPRSQLGSLYIPPLAAQEPSRATPPVSQLNKAPTPWMTRQSQQEVPSWVHKENVQSPPPQYSQSNQGNQSNQGYQGNQGNQGYQGNQGNQGYQQPQTRVIPIQIEGKEPSQPNTRIIPIQLEGTPSPQKTPQQPNFNQQQSYQQQQPQYQQQQYQQQHSYEQQQQNQGRQTPRWMNQQPVYVHNKFNTGSQSPVPAEQNHRDNQPSWRHSQTNGTMQSPGPVQSQSFKVLQKITGTDKDGVDQNDAPYNSQGVPLSQLRKLQLSDDDRALMNKVKSQVDDETYLHNESDPRYRGSAIPSRAFRILQSMTDGTGDDSDVPRGYSPAQAGQNRLGSNRTPQPDMPQQYVPPSEQQVQEPRKYTGGAIPSRSFRMLQAMTAGPDSADQPGESEY